ncbi:MAG: STAS domain-containing protein [Streptosporangiaceae bacterium]
MELKVAIQPQGDHTVIYVTGEIDLYTAPRLQAELMSALRGTEAVRLIVDMSGIEFCDSTGMNVFLMARGRAQEQGGDLQLAAPRPMIKKVLQVTGLDSVFTVLPEPAAGAGQ